MTRRNVISLWLLIGLITLAARATEFPEREQLQKDGWTIGFAPNDRPLAEALAKHIGDFEKRFAAIESTELSLGPAELEARATELASQTAGWCALPKREADFEREFQQVALRVREIRTQVRRALLVRAIEIWRPDEIAVRFATNDGVPGVRWNATEKRLALDAHINLQSNFANDQISARVIAPSAVMLQIGDQKNQKSVVAALVASFNLWVDVFESPGADPGPTTMRIAAGTGIGRAVAAAVAPDTSSRWIAAGLSSWVWRELVFTTLQPERANRYAPVVPVLAVPAAGEELLNLEQWPADDETDHVKRAFQVFLNIAEHHGKDAIPQVMTQFWKLPTDQRTTAALKEVYRTLWDEPLEARAPWRSLGPVP